MELLIFVPWPSQTPKKLQDLSEKKTGITIA